VEEAILKIYSLVNLGFLNNKAVFISKLSTPDGCCVRVTMRVYRTSRATTALWVSFIEALKDVEQDLS
jgi:hypothetical protein